MNTLRDRSWLWCHVAGAHNGAYGLPGDSSISPAEAARSMGLRNVIMVAYGGEPQPPLLPHAQQFLDEQRLVWSIIGDSSSTRNDRQTDLEEVIGLAQHMPNLCGAMMDDFFHEPKDGLVSRYAPRQLIEFRRCLRQATRPLDLWVVLYDHQLHLPVQQHLQCCDVVTLWTWQSRNLEHLEQNFGRARELAGDRRMVLGCYMWDYGEGHAMPPHLMQHQCELGRRWLHEGQVEGLIFLGSGLCDLPVETMQWTREWLASDSRAGEE